MSNEHKYSSAEYLNKVDAWWRAANYLSIGQIYLKDNPLLRRPLEEKDVKINPIGHWGTVPGQNFVYAHLNRVINKYDLDMFFIEGPGHGGQVMVSNAYLDGSYTEIYPDITEDEEGMKKLFRQFSFPGGIGSHAAPETPGSIHEGGELGYALSHATGTVLDYPDTIAAVTIGDGEAETGALATSWFSNVFINPVTDGAVLPILHLNGYKIANPTILSRKSNEELRHYFDGLGWDPHFVEGENPDDMHPEMAETMDIVIEKIRSIQTDAREKTTKNNGMPKWPVIILISPKGWTGPEEWDGEPVEGTFRAHQVPIPAEQEKMEYSGALMNWMRSYRPEELFDENGRLKSKIKEITPKDNKRMALNPITNGGRDGKPLKLPDWREYTLDIKTPGSEKGKDMSEFGKFARDIVDANPDNFRIMSTDELKSNKLNAVLQKTNRQWMEDIEEPEDEAQSLSGRVIDSQLSEHQAEGWMEGYTLTGRHGFFVSYEGFLRIVDSMITQHFKWLRKADELEWRNKYPSLNIIASSTVFQQDHNGYTHQDPGLSTHLAEKKLEYIREYFPADANTLMAVMNKVLKSEQKINLIVSSKHPRPQFYTAKEAEELVEKGLKIIDWASTFNDDEPDIVIAAAGTEPNLEALAAVSILHDEVPELKIRFINVVDILRLNSPKNDKRGLSNEAFNDLFTTDKPVLFAFHGYEGLLKNLFFDRQNRNLIPHGYRENGDVTTPFDMRVVNDLDRFHLVKDAARALYGEEACDVEEKMDKLLDKHHKYIREIGDDMPEVTNWKWRPLK
ncbi:phosphoketolase [Alkalibacterium sp. 20]|uniref:phosphoketolase family protein n=1 Tax=Alkalibacterium sp. 20 TaxID=1798803 RepID=UPI0009002E47|nr:phosphoketolase family protein [Alkalibacterium sp. 20]OJF91779.1 phosphoketolase [Alkalibacterium sp. 20]